MVTVGVVDPASGRPARSTTRNSTAPRADDCAATEASWYSTDIAAAVVPGTANQYGIAAAFEFTVPVTRTVPWYSPGARPVASSVSDNCPEPCPSIAIVLVETTGAGPFTGAAVTR